MQIIETSEKCVDAPAISSISRRFPIGAEVMPDGGVSFRVWAPARKKVEVALLNSGTSFFELSSEGNGYFSGAVGDQAEGALYKYRLDSGDLFPDPASRFQPQGPHGPSQVI
ncbi:MAG TPA: hypothetical protein VF493_05515, partial [Terriglobales bacterium]